MGTSLSHDAAALRQWAALAWCEVTPEGKLAAVRAIEARLANASRVDPPALDPARLALAQPGRPAAPRLVDPRSVPARPTSSPLGRAALLHAIAHIEFNAINLALDAAWRFDRMPMRFLLDWLSVAIDEARHFRLLSDELEARGHAYGDFDAHDGLWQMAWKTRADVLARMALVPRVLEARGLDATPPLQRRLRAAGDERAASILQVILDEEVRHVAIGNQWFHRLCRERGCEPLATFVALLGEHGVSSGRGAINRDARLAAGFSAEEIRWLERPARPPDQSAPAREA